MGNEATKLEIKIRDSDYRPFEPGDRIVGEVVVTTAKPLKDISGIEVRFEGSSWIGEPGEQMEREIYVDKSTNLPVDGSQLKRPGQHRFAFSFDIPPECKSSVAFSRFAWTKYGIAASLQRKGVDLCSAARKVRILAQPVEPAGDGNNNGPSHGENGNEIAHPSNAAAASPASVERSMVIGEERNPRCNHLLVKSAAMRLQQLPKRIYQPGECIPINGTFQLETKLAGPFNIKASLGYNINRILPTSQTADVGGGEKQGESQDAPEEYWLEDISIYHPAVWKDRPFWLPPTVPTESSLFHRFRNRRCLVIAMEQYKNPDGGKPKRLEVTFPIQIGN